MTDSSHSRRPPRRFWGWGRADAALDAREQANLRFMLDQLGAVQGEAAPPRVEDFALRAPRITPPPSLAAMCSCLPLDRLNHSYGKGYADLARMWQRDVPEPPDWVAFPDDEQAVIDILDWAARNNVAVIPYGGGSSVCGGVEPAVGASYAGTVSMDLERLHRVLEGDRTSRAARIPGAADGGLADCRRRR